MTLPEDAADHVLANRASWDADAEMPADPLATAEWSRRWPIEEVWKARKAG